jgi:hypothetical protein
MAKCPAITRSGESCRGFVRPGDEFCVAHDPDRAEERKAAASKAGRSKTTAEFREVKAQLRQLANDVLSGRVDKGRASVVAQVLGVWCKVTEAEVRTREFQEIQLPEFEEVVRRVEAIEELQALRGGNGWAG